MNDYNWKDTMWTEFAVGATKRDKATGYVFTVDSNPMTIGHKWDENGKEYIGLPTAFVDEIDDCDYVQDIGLHLKQRSDHALDYARPDGEFGWQWGAYYLHDGEWREIVRVGETLKLVPVEGRWAELRLQRVLSYCDLQQEKGFLLVSRESF